MWKTQTGEREPFWCTSLIFTHADVQCFIPPELVHQGTRHTQDLHYNIPSDWVVHHSLSGYIDNDGWLKSMYHFDSMCFSSTLNSQVLLHDGHGRKFDDRALYILWSYHIQSFFLKAGGSVHDQFNDNFPNLKLKNLYGCAIMKWKRSHGYLNFTLAYMNTILVESWRAFILSSETITQGALKKTHLLPLSPTDKETNHQA